MEDKEYRDILEEANDYQPKLRFIKDLDRSLFDLFYRLYNPFFSFNIYHDKENYKYTICAEKQVIGFTIFGQLFHLGIIPEYQRRGLSRKIADFAVRTRKPLFEKMKYDKSKQLWIAHVKNYPSLKAFYNMGSGVINTFSENGEIYVSGYRPVWRYGVKPVSLDEKRNLEKILSSSKRLYENWIKTEYANRGGILHDLEVYVDKHKIC